MSSTVTKKILIERIALQTGLKRSDVRRVVQTCFDEMIASLGEGDRIEFRDFGIWEVKTTKARLAQNPKTLERVEVPEKRTVRFRPGRRMKDHVGGQQPALQLVGSID